MAGGSEAISDCPHRDCFGTIMPRNDKGGVSLRGAAGDEAISPRCVAKGIKNGAALILL